MKKRILLFTIIFCATTAYAQENINVSMSFVYTEGVPICTFMKDPYETEATLVSPDFFNTPMSPQWRVGQYFVLDTRLPKQYNYFLVKVQSPYNDNLQYTACIATTDDIHCCMPSFTFMRNFKLLKKTYRDIERFGWYSRDSIIVNTMDIYREARRLQSLGQRREANKLYELAAQCGNVLAAQQLAENYRNGVGCFRSPQKAYYWYQIASAFGDLYSTRMLEDNRCRKKTVVVGVWR